MTPVYRNFAAKIFSSADEAIADIPHGATIGFGGFGMVGVPENLIRALERRGTMDLTCVSSEAGINGHGIDNLIRNRQVKKLVGNYIGSNQNVHEQYFSGELELELVPSGSFAERLRAAGAGIPAFYTRTGVGTIVGDGGVVLKFKNGGEGVDKVSVGEDMRTFRGKRYLLVRAINTDYSFVKGYQADEYGNVTFRKSALNFNLDIAKAGKTCIVEVEEIVPAGAIDPHHIKLPQIYVQRIIKGEKYDRAIEHYTVKKRGEKAADSDFFKTPTGKMKKKIVERATKFIEDGMYINLGIGIPSLIANFIDRNRGITLHSENGIMGLGEFPYEDEVDPDDINAGKQLVTVDKGGSYVSTSESFGMIRGGHIDITFLGGMQVSEDGDLANWIVPGKVLKGIGGAMDLVAGTEKIVVCMKHNTKTQDVKVLRDCSFPLTGAKCVDALVTEKAVFQWDTKGKMVLTDVAKESSLEDIRANTEAIYRVSDDLKQF